MELEDLCQNCICEALHMLGDDPVLAVERLGEAELPCDHTIWGPGFAYQLVRITYPLA